MNPIGPRNLVSLLMRGTIRLYQLLLSPVLPSSCRFSPSCSAYAMQAIKIHGPLTGSWLGVRRICRCHPWNDGGFDPVPPALADHAHTDHAHHAHTDHGGLFRPSRLPE